MSLHLDFVTAENTRSRDRSAGRAAAFAQLKHLFDHFRSHGDYRFTRFDLRTDVLELATLLVIARPILLPWIRVNAIVLEASHITATASARFRALLPDLVTRDEGRWVDIGADRATSLQTPSHVADFKAMTALVEHDKASLPRIDFISQVDRRDIAYVLQARMRLCSVAGGHLVWGLPRYGTPEGDSVFLPGYVMRASSVFGVHFGHIDVDMEHTCTEIVQDYSHAQCIAIGAPRRTPDDYWGNEGDWCIPAPCQE
jgi:hypothetical protein